MTNHKIILMTLGLLLALLAVVPGVATSNQPHAVERRYLPMLVCGRECQSTGEASASPTRTITASPSVTAAILPSPEPSATATPIGYSAYRMRAIELINSERAKAGCPAARVHPDLMRATQDWSITMDTTGDFRHAPGEWYDNVYHYTHPVLENIGVAGTPELFVQGMLDSPPHKANMLDCYYSKPANPGYNPAIFYEIGVGESNFAWTMAISTVRP